MLPKNAEAALEHTRRKRELEIRLAMEGLADLLRRQGRLGHPDFESMEFGCGDGFQIPHLRRFGKAAASDLYRSARLDGLGELDFRQCGIERTPFERERFDLIYSNQVFQDIPEALLPAIHAEAQRILKPGGLLAFTVPTPLWLVFRIPAQYLGTAQSLARRAQRRGNDPATPAIASPPDGAAQGVQGRDEGALAKALRVLLPSGYGAYPGFWEAARKYRTRSWISRFEAAGFSFLEAKPLLIYAPSEWPVVPTTARLNPLGICSSVLLSFTAGSPPRKPQAV